MRTPLSVGKRNLPEWKECKVQALPGLLQRITRRLSQSEELSKRAEIAVHQAFKKFSKEDIDSIMANLRQASTNELAEVTNSKGLLVDLLTCFMFHYKLGTVPAQENPDERSQRGEINWATETVRYIPLRESEIKAPSSMFIIGDRAGWLTRPDGSPAAFVGSSTLSSGSVLGGLSRRHGKKTNITFMDGHAESLRAEQTLGKTREVARRWNRTNEGIKKRYTGRFKPVFLDE